MILSPTAYMANPRILCQTEHPNSPPRRGRLSAKLWGPLPVSHQDTTHNPTAQQSGLNRIWNPHCVAWPPISQFSGPPTCPGWSTPTTPWSALPRVCHRSWSHGFQPPFFPSQETEVAVPSVQPQFCRVPGIWQEARAALQRTTAQNRRLADQQ